MRELQFRLGWVRVADLQTLMLVLRAGPAVEGKVPTGTRAVAAAALGTVQTLRRWRGRVRAGCPFTAESVARFGPAHDALWARVQSAFAVAVVRDASYLNWKYCDQPGQDFARLEIRRNGDVIGIAVISLSEPDRVYRTRRAFLTDVVVKPDEARDVWAVLEAARQYAVKRAADLLLFDVLNNNLVRAASAFGFARRQPARVLLVATETPPGPIASLVRDGANWLITRGDSDIDRPW
jgi:hypothetical protein